MKLLEIMQKRHSVRSYTEEHVKDKDITSILQAGLLSPSGRSKRPWELILVKDRNLLNKMAECRDGAANMLKGADCAIVVTGNPDISDTWIEDCSIVMSNMHLMADSLGVGSCWIQGRQRKAKSGESTEDYLRKLLGFPSNYKLLAILSIGMPKSHREKQELSSLPMEKVHYEKY